jgi:RimJ/RimL family protein N-acetyltransferase
MTADIRTATAADLPALAALRRTFTFEDPEPFATLRPDFEQAFLKIVGDGIASGRWTIWLAEADGEIVSHVYIGLIDKIPRPTRGSRWLGYMTNVYTRPEQRGRGIGAAVLQQVTAWAVEHDVELLVVWPSDESVAFYERAGFVSGRDPLVWMPG